MNLSPNFSLAELIQSDTAVRLGIDNDPPLEVVPALKILMAGLEQVRTALGDKPIKINSGYRSEALEKELTKKDFAAWCKRNGKNFWDAWPEYFARKDHPKGYAADLVCPSFGTPVQIVRQIINMGLCFDQLIEEGTWVHISFNPAMRGIVLTARFDKQGVPTYTAS